MWRGEKDSQHVQSPITLAGGSKPADEYAVPWSTRGGAALAVFINDLSMKWGAQTICGVASNRAEMFCALWRNVRICMDN